MPPLIPDSVPRHFAQGTTVRFTRSLPNYPPSEGWQYTLYMNGVAQKISAAGVIFDAATFLVEIDAAATSSLPPGPYRYAERLTNPGTQFVLTGVSVDGQGNATYSFSSFTDMQPYVGMPVTITGFTNAGNNAAGAAIAKFFGGPQGGTFTIANAGAVNETHAAAAQGAQQADDITGDTLVINVEPSAATSPAGAFQTFEEQTLAALKLMIANRVNGTTVKGDVLAYQIAGRSLSKMPLPELMQLRGYYESLVWQQQHPGKLSKPRKAEFSVEGEDTHFPPTWQDVTGLER